MRAKQPASYLDIVPAVILVLVGSLLVDIRRATHDEDPVSHTDYLLQMMPLLVAGLVAYFGLLIVNLPDLRRLFTRDWEFQLVSRLRGPWAYFIFLMRIIFLSALTALNCLLLIATFSNSQMPKSSLSMWFLILLTIVVVLHLFFRRKHLGVHAWVQS
jgi:hypothetical protein